MPPSRPIVSPTGVLTHTDPAAQITRCQELRAQALATVPANDEQAMDKATYLAYLQETEAMLKEKTR